MLRHRRQNKKVKSRGQLASVTRLAQGGQEGSEWASSFTCLASDSCDDNLLGFLCGILKILPGKHVFERVCVCVCVINLQCLLWVIIQQDVALSPFLPVDVVELKRRSWKHLFCLLRGKKKREKLNRRLTGRFLF